VAVDREIELIEVNTPATSLAVAEARNRPTVKAFLKSLIEARVKIDLLGQDLEL
jgi:hypothetical protein